MNPTSTLRMRRWTAFLAIAWALLAIFLSIAGLRDKLTPVEGLDTIDRELQRVYAALGHPERWKLLRYDVEHQETAEGRLEIIAFLKRFM